MPARLWLLTLCFVLGVSTFAITGFPTELRCPVCDETNVLYVWASSGGYIYQWPSKFQLIFWPATDANNVFLCKKCHFAVFSQDWHEPPKEKLAATRELLKGVIRLKIPAPKFAPADKEEDKQWKRMVYAEVPVSERLAIAEKIYGDWGRNDEFWCHFYRVLGYHLQAEKKDAEAAAARRKALDLAVKLAGDEKRAGEKKHFLVIIAAMKHYLKNDIEALTDLNSAAGLKFEAAGLKPENNKGYDEYLSKLISEYIQKLKTGESTDEKPEG